MDHGEISPEHNKLPAYGNNDVSARTTASHLLASLPSDVAATAVEHMEARLAVAALQTAAERDQLKAANIVAELHPKDFLKLAEAWRRRSPDDLGELLKKVPSQVLAEKLGEQSNRHVEKLLKVTEPDYAKEVRGALQARMNVVKERSDIGHLATQIGKEDPATAAHRVMADSGLVKQAPRIFSEMKKPEQAANILTEM